MPEGVPRYIWKLIVRGARCWVLGVGMYCCISLCSAFSSDHSFRPSTRPSDRLLPKGANDLGFHARSTFGSVVDSFGLVLNTVLTARLCLEEAIPPEDGWTMVRFWGPAWARCPTVRTAVGP